MPTLTDVTNSNQLTTVSSGQASRAVTKPNVDAVNVVISSQSLNQTTISEGASKKKKKKNKKKKKKNNAKEGGGVTSAGGENDKGKDAEVELKSELEKGAGVGGGEKVEGASLGVENLVGVEKITTNDKSSKEEDEVARNLGLVPLVDEGVEGDNVKAPIFPYPPTPPPGNQQDGGKTGDDTKKEEEDFVMVESAEKVELEVEAGVEAGVDAEAETDEEGVWSKFAVKMDNTPAKERLKNGSLPGPFAEISDPGSFKPSSTGKDLTRKSVVAKSCLTPEPGAAITSSRYRVSPVASMEGEVAAATSSTTSGTDRTPMTHIKLGELEIDSEEEKAELDTPNEKKLVRKLTKKGSSMLEAMELDSEIKKMKKGSIGGAAKGGTLEDKYGAWNDYEYISRMEGSGSSPQKLKSNQWVCNLCTLVNDKEHALVCKACGGARKGEDKDNEVEKWECKNCTFHNTDMGRKKCEMCFQKRENEAAFEMEIEIVKPEAEERKEGSKNNDKGNKGKGKKKGIWKWMFGGRK